MYGSYPRGTATPGVADDWESVESLLDFARFLLLSTDWDAEEAKGVARAEPGLWAGEGKSWASGSPRQWTERLAPCFRPARTTSAEAAGT